jgi:hypothetical protein
VGACWEHGEEFLGDCQLLEKDSPAGLDILELQSTGYVGATFSLRYQKQEKDIRIALVMREVGRAVLV